MAEAVFGAVAAAKFVGFVDYGDIPWRAAQLVLDLAGKLVGNDDDRVASDGRRIACFQFERMGTGIENEGGEVEFVPEFQAPLFAERSGADDQQAAPFLSPELAEDETRFDGFAQAHFVGEEHAFDRWGAEKIERGFDLVGVEVDGRVEERGAELVNSVGGVPGQLMCKIAGMVFRNHNTENTMRRTDVNR